MFSVSHSRTGSRRSGPGITALTLLLVIVQAGCNANSDEPVVFGFAGPIQEAYGASARMGAELAQAEINAAGGIDGRPLELLIRDDAANPKQAIEIAERFVANPDVLAVVGHVNSGTMTAAATVYEKGLPALATSATSPSISQLGDWIFRVTSSDSANAVELSRLALEISEPTAILYENDDYGRGLSNSFRSSFEALGGEILESDPYLGSTEDLRPYLERLRMQDVGLVFIAGLEQGAARIIQQANELGLDSRFLGGDGLEGLVNMGDAYNGTLVGMLYHPDASPAARDFADKFTAAYNRPPDSFAALAYDAVYLMKRAVEEGGAGREKIRDHLATVGRPDGSPPFEGASGTIRFDENGDPLGKDFAVGVIQNGSIQILNGQNR